MKKCKINDVAIQSVTLGFIAGSRAASAPAVTSILLAGGSKPASKILAAVAGKKIMRMLMALALPELVIDKMPGIGNRTEAGGLAARMVTGGLGGAALYRAADKPAAIGLATGATAAIISTFALFHLRKTICAKTKIPDPWVGLAEDVLMLSAALWLVKRKGGEK